MPYIKVGIENFFSAGEFFDGRFVDLCSLHQCLDSSKFPKKLQLLSGSLYFQTCVPQPLHVRFPPPRTHSKA